MKHLLSRGLLVLALATLPALSAHAGDLKLTIHAGRATILAQDVPVRQILEEWSRVGQTKIVNADKVTGPPLTLQLINVPEKDALDILLRSVSGYMAAPREALVADASIYDRIMIMPTSHAPMVSASAAPPAPAPFQRPPMPMQVDDDDEPVNVTLPGAAPPPATPMPNPGVVGSFPGAQPPMSGPGGQTPPALSAQPGVVVGSPQTPNGPQPASPFQPTVVRPGGGGGEGVR